MIQVLDSAGSTLVEWGRQQQQQQDDFFKELGCWGQEGNGSIGEALVGIFVWFGNRYYFCYFPDLGNDIFIEG